MLGALSFLLLNIAHGRCGDSVIPGGSFCEEFYLIEPSNRPIFFVAVGLVAAYLIYRIVSGCFIHELEADGLRPSDREPHRGRK
ncbi:hypothetical protein CXX84_15555 [Arthrobacter sp. AFG7.2]|nr:hypothetical protein CXX84_15555 [Arthrobacter sp. AFG7.2]